MISITPYIVLVVYFALVIFWIILLIKGTKKYQDYLAPLNNKEHILKDLYGVGFEFLDLIHYTYNSPVDRKRITECRIVYGEKYGDYYYRVNLAEKMTLTLTIAIAAIILYPMTGQLLFFALGLVGAACGYWYADMQITDVMKARNESITRDFPEVLSQIALLTNAGMIMKEAWTTVSETGEGVLYEEMRTAVLNMRDGMPEVEAYVYFGNRCGQKSVKKFTSLLIQNLMKGNRELVDFLKLSATDSWEEKKQLVKQKGEKASTKLMIPIGMILIGILIMILVPILSNLGI
jgi:tight adherence protein C